MSLTGRFSALFLSAMALVLVGFSTALYVSARIYFERQIRDRLSTALAVLSAAAEVHPDGVEWEPQERILPLGQESGADRLRWMVFDDRGRRIDHSRNLVDADLTAAMDAEDRDRRVAGPAGRPSGSELAGVAASDPARRGPRVRLRGSDASRSTGASGRIRAAPSLPGPDRVSPRSIRPRRSSARWVGSSPA